MCTLYFDGEVTEWLMVTVLKTVVRQRTAGSNPALSAKLNNDPCGRYLIFLEAASYCVEPP